MTSNTHPHRKERDVVRITSVFTRAFPIAFRSTWKEDLIRSIPAPKTLLLLPPGFEMHTNNLTYGSQVARVIASPESFNTDRLQDVYSAVVFFSPTHHAPISRWLPIWEFILSAIANRDEVILCASPRNRADWERCIDQMHFVALTIQYLFPDLTMKIKNLLPTRAVENNKEFPWNVLTNETSPPDKAYSAVATRAFINASVSFYSR
ncbi:hypothetical protein Aduo_018697 [Ancylostoma duodenale]